MTELWNKANHQHFHLGAQVLEQGPQLVYKEWATSGNDRVPLGLRGGD